MIFLQLFGGGTDIEVETISQRSQALTVRISRADCVPVTLPPRPAGKHVSVSQSWSAEPPTKEPLR